MSAGATTQAPSIGIAVFIMHPNHPNCILLGKRIGQALGSGKFGVPGGRLEANETWEGCAEREVREETGLIVQCQREVIAISGGEATMGESELYHSSIRSPSLLHFNQTLFRESNQHFLTIYMVAHVSTLPDMQCAEPQVLEPTKCEWWKWIHIDDLRLMHRHLFEPLATAIQQGILTTFQTKFLQCCKT